MREISDITRDTRPKIEKILTEAIHDIIDSDKLSGSDNIDSLERENRTFYYRVIFLFMTRVVEFYNEKEVEDWCKKELLNEIKLPEL